MGKIILVLFYLVAPAVVLWACNKSKILGKIGPVLVCYILGIVIGNIHILPSGSASIQELLCTIMVPLAIPMMLFGCDFKKFSIRTSLLATIIGVVSVTVVVVAGFFLFRERMGENSAIIGGALAGKFTGGTPNLVALHKMLHMPEETFLVLNTFDMVACFIYLVFLMSFGIKWARKWLGTGKWNTNQEVNVEEFTEKNPYKDFGKKHNVEQLLKIFFSSLLLVGASFAVATVAKGYEASIFELVMFLSLTTLSLIFATWKEVKSWDKSYDAGMYLIYIFSVVVASRADLTAIDFHGSFYLFFYLLLSIFGSLGLTLLLGKIFRISGDMAIITSNTLINSPIFVPMIAAQMRNRDIIIVGMSIGLVGYALGNYLGYIVFLMLGGTIL